MLIIIPPFICTSAFPILVVTVPYGQKYMETDHSTMLCQFYSNEAATKTLEVFAILCNIQNT
jgi:RNA-binding protein YlmH